MSRNSKRVLATEADGFLGSPLVELPARQDPAVTALSHYNSFSDRGGPGGLPCLNGIQAVAGARNLCQAALPPGVERFGPTSTSEIRGAARYVPFAEWRPLCGQSPYRAGKLGAVARPFNPYGPRQSAGAAVPTIVSQIAAGKEEIGRGDLTAARDSTFVTDACRGILAVASRAGTPGGVFNIGSSIDDFVDLLSPLAVRPHQGTFNAGSGAPGSER